jgi:hypothetical protein
MSSISIDIGAIKSEGIAIGTCRAIRMRPSIRRYFPISVDRLAYPTGFPAHPADGVVIQDCLLPVYLALRLTALRQLGLAWRRTFLIAAIRVLDAPRRTHRDENRGVVAHAPSKTVQPANKLGSLHYSVPRSAFCDTSPFFRPLHFTQGVFIPIVIRNGVGTLVRAAPPLVSETWQIGRNVSPGS